MRFKACMKLNFLKDCVHVSLMTMLNDNHNISLFYDASILDVCTKILLHVLSYEQISSSENTFQYISREQEATNYTRKIPSDLITYSRLRL